MKIMKSKIRVLKGWLPIALAITLLSGMMYVVVLQTIRQSANDPQIELVRDVVNELNQGVPPFRVVPSNKFEISRSLSPYLMVFDELGNLVASSAVLDGVNPSLPKGVFDFVKSNGQDRITWQPREGIRQALIVERFDGKQSGYVAVGRSLEESENRVDTLGKGVAIGWFITLISSLIVHIIF